MKLSPKSVILGGDWDYDKDGIHEDFVKSEKDKQELRDEIDKKDKQFFETFLKEFESFVATEFDEIMENIKEVESVKDKINIDSEIKNLFVITIETKKDDVRRYIKNKMTNLEEDKKGTIVDSLKK